MVSFLEFAGIVPRTDVQQLATAFSYQSGFVIVNSPNFVSSGGIAHAGLQPG
jgi:hypothetical protein